MMVCISAQGDNLQSMVDSRFGRCRYFIIADTESDKFTAIENPYRAVSGGAGIQSGQFVVKQKAKVVLAGNVGPNAFHTLKAANIEVITGVKGTVKDVLKIYKRAQFSPVQCPSVDVEFGQRK
jgi:predicted Fe-Mo cluster-binding NifX family protein